MKYHYCIFLTIVINYIFTFQLKAESLTFACAPGSESRTSSTVMKEITELSAQYAGINTKFIDYPWVRVIALLKNGKVAGSHCMSYIDQRRQFVNYLDIPFYVGKVHFFKNANNPLRYESLEQLLKLKIAVHEKSYIAHTLKTMGATNLELVFDGLSLCRLLVANRVDLIGSNTTEEAIACYETFEKREIMEVDVEPIGPAFAVDTLHLALSRQFPDHEKLKSAIYKGFLKALKSGEIENIYKKHNAETPIQILGLIRKTKDQ